MIGDKRLVLVKSLHNPKVFGDDVDRVEMRQTHMSWIFLAGRYAWKIKKPLDLGFADFTTLEKRHHFCQEELRLNRRLAPDMYLDVLPITGSAAAPAVGGEGRPIEYAVKMQRFPESSLLTHVLERHELHVQHLTRLARDVAAFHARIGVAPSRSRFGKPQSIWEPMKANLHYLSASLSGSSEQAAVELLTQWCENEFASRRDEFARRAADGYVRECHGDMHLGNMVLDNDVITVFDGIEFNESLRWIDVLNEIAFLVMDLEYRERPDLARRFLNSYLEQTGDYRGLAVLRYYLVYRALVRAKVTCIRCSQPRLDDPAKMALSTQTARYLELACRWTRSTQPRIVITHGVAGSGKTCETEPLVDQLGMIRIRSDAERKRLFGSDPHDSAQTRFEEGVYSAAATSRTYHQLADLASAVVRAGYSALIDATFLQRRQRDLLRRAAHLLGVPFLILDFRTRPETLLRTDRAAAAEGERPFRCQCGGDVATAEESTMAGW